MIKKLQKRSNGKIVMCNMGSFYITIGKDAVLLNNLIGLKVSCIETGICKVGFPINSLEKQLEKRLKTRANNSKHAKGIKKLKSQKC